MASPPSPDFSGFIAKLAAGLDAAAIPFMLIGGQAVLLHGQPRLTEDIDVTLGVGPDALERVREVCASLGLIALPQDPEAFVLDTFVLPVRHAQTGIRVDLVFSTTPYEQQAIARATKVMLAGVEVPFASAEDLIVHKLFAGRPRDWEDAIGVVRRKGASLDWTYVERWAGEFAGIPGREDLPDRVARLRTMS